MYIIYIILDIKADKMPFSDFTLCMYFCRAAFCFCACCLDLR